MAQMTSTGVEDRRDPLYRKKHAGVPGNGGQTAEHERTETGKSVINASIDTLDVDDTAKRAFAEAAMRATSPLDLIDRRVEAVETYIADKYIATEFNALSSYNEHRLSDDEIDELNAQHELDKAKWGPAVEAAAAFVGAPVGSTEAAIRRTLDHHAMAAGAIEQAGFKGSDKKRKRAARK